MNLINVKVLHKTLGEGCVISQDDKHIKVKFAIRTCEFQYPEAFRKFLMAEDLRINEIIMSEIAVNDAKIAEEKQRIEAERKAEEDRKLEEFAKKAGHKTMDKVIKRVERIEGQNLTFLVFQGNTFDAEYRGGFIWAPKYNQAGKTCHHWDRLLDVREGDLIVHCADGYIQAISMAKGICYDAESPRELSEEQLWAKDGRMIDCDYIKVENTVKHSDYKDTILKYCQVKYAPFDKDGNGNMGYLFDLDKELARFFIEKIVVKNGYLLEVKGIQNILK